MPGETNLKILLRSLQPHLHAEPYVFCTLAEDDQRREHCSALATFHEAEGLSVIMPLVQATMLNLPVEAPMAWISLTIHSSLVAVGLTAALSTCLAEQGISCNVVAAFYHDHLFVPWEQRNQALMALRELAVGK